MVGMEIRCESRWTGIIVAEIGVFIWWFGARALNSLLTGEPFYVRGPKKKWQHYVAIGVFAVGILILVAAQTWITSKGLRDFLSISGLMMSFFAGCYITIFEEELNK